MAEQLAAKNIRGRQLNEEKEGKSVEAKQLALHRSSVEPTKKHVELTYLKT
jgi:hypothetical protein